MNELRRLAITIIEDIEEHINKLSEKELRDFYELEEDIK